MNNTNSMNSLSLIGNWFQNSHVGHLWTDTSKSFHIVVIIGLAFLVHLLVKVIRHLSEWLINKSHEKKNPFVFVTQQPKFITLTRLIVSALTFVVYALAIFFVLLVIDPTATGNTFKTYLTSAAVVGLALSFGLQGLVQDVVTGITLILSDAIDAGDIVDLSGTIGRV